MTAPRGVEAETAPHIHPPKTEIFDLEAMTNTDPKGIVRAVREYRVEPFGLYLARDVVGHRSIRSLESWLLPELGLRITDWCYSAGHEWQDHFYIDVVRIDIDFDTRCWRTEDHYLDLIVRPGRGVDVVDTDELLDAVLAGLLDPVTAQTALATTYRTVDGLARHGYLLDRWLSTVGMRPTWSRR
jgi:predicted RNA-binding protein associated with RNAse of E/G family